MLRRLAYVSRPRPDLPVTEIPRIVAVSRANNQNSGLYGVLVYTGTDFAQLIEGDPGGVEALWKLVRADPRHLDVKKLLDEQCSSPWFSDWRMGYLPDRAHALRLSEWRTLNRAMSRDELAALRTLFAAADAL